MEHFKYIVGGWLWQILAGSIRTVARVWEAAKIFFLFPK